MIGNANLKYPVSPVRFLKFSVKAAVGVFGYRILKQNTQLDDCIKGKHLILTTTPKSGSTYLTRVLCEITGFPKTPIWERHAEVLSPYVISKHNSKNYISRVHAIADLRNKEILLENNLSVVVQVRNIYDTIVSMRDHLLNPHEKRLSSGYTYYRFRNLSEIDQYWYLAKIHCPWLLSFAQSWIDVENEINIHWITYEELFSNQIAVIADLLSFWEMEYSDEVIISSVEKIQNSKNIRKNKALMGRGEMLPSEIIHYIRDLPNLLELDEKVYEYLKI